MTFTALDWTIVLSVLAFMVAGVVLSRTYMRSVADFLAAGRTAGRYLLSLSQGAAALGAITVVGLLEMNYVAGFAMTWWGFTMSVVVLIVTVSGWVIYRYRQTRALTLAEFFERRYSRRFRVFAGLIAFTSGVVNFGIFPAVGARFFIAFTGLPPAVTIFGIAISTFPLTMIVLLSIALFFVFWGGQVAVIIADFIQGLFMNVVFIAVPLYLMFVVNWGQVVEALAMAPDNKSLINPFETGYVEDFNFWYFLIGVLIYVYGTMSWQGTQAYNASAKSAHEAKMGSVLTNWRNYPQNLLILFVPIIAYTVMHHPDFAVQAGQVNAMLSSVGTEALQNQMRVPLVLKVMLPVGLLGAFAAVMLAAFISTHDTYLHSWGSIFIQDVVMPFRTTPFTPEQHFRALRWSILGVACFIFCFSLLFQQSEYIFLFFAITGAIFFGGAGSVIIGGLYWKRGTTAAAWAAMIVGSGISVGGIIVHRIIEDFFINGQVFAAIAIGASVVVYIVVSLLGRAEAFDLDRLLHRGAHATSETQVVTEVPTRGWKVLGMGKEFTRRDKILYIVTYAHTVFWVAVFIAGTVYSLTHTVDNMRWAEFWRLYLYVQVALSIIVLVWFAIGGIADLRAMLTQLRITQRDVKDDGYVEAGE